MNEKMTAKYLLTNFENQFDNQTNYLVYRNLSSLFCTITKEEKKKGFFLKG